VGVGGGAGWMREQATRKLDVVRRARAAATVVFTVETISRLSC